MVGGNALKIFGGIVLVVIPLVGTSYFARPTFANAISNKLAQEQEEEKRKHMYSSDHYTRNGKTDNMIKRYMDSGSGKPRQL